jgi:hypothetical protein
MIDITDTELKVISNLAERQLFLQNRLAELNSQVKQTEEELRRIQESELPDSMFTVGIAEFKLANGMKITIKDDVFASIRKDYIVDAVDWLNDNGLGDIVKDKVEISFGRGDAWKAQDIIELCKKNGYDASETLSVHPQTLKAAVKEQMAKGIEFPERYFSVFPFKKAVIKQ